MNKIYFYILFIFALVGCKKQVNTDLIVINELSNRMHEVSGITMFANDNYIYAINDSGNRNTIFCLNQEGEIIAEIPVPESKNKDWEDLTYDPNGNIYIGDFGNNDNKRKDLVIYKVTDVLSSTIKTSKIEFVLEDQKKFPPGKKHRNFDIEAFVHLNGSLYLFSKNRCSNFDGTTKLYRLPSKPGKHVAQLIASYQTCKDPNDCSITGAAVNPKGTQVALLTHDKIFLLTNFEKHNLFSGNIEKIKLNHYSQKESICFKNDSTLYITDEQTHHSNSYLYKYDL